jgi:chromosome partitioning protein
MKTLVFANQKGGVGKSALAVQYAYYLALDAEKRVIVIDMDHQRNSTSALTKGGFASVAEITSVQVLNDKDAAVEKAAFVLVPGDRDLIKMEKFAGEHNAYATNLFNFLERINDEYDVCIIDTNPNPDIRQLASLVVTDYVVSPLQLNQEAIDGIGDLLNHSNIGIRRIQETLNEKLHFLGVLPNLVEPTPFQKENLHDLSKAYSKLMIPLDKGFAAIKKTTAIPEAQAVGLPVWHLKKTSARSAWAQIRPIFQRLTKNMEV